MIASTLCHSYPCTIRCPLAFRERAREGSERPVIEKKMKASSFARGHARGVGCAGMPLYRGSSPPRNSAHPGPYSRPYGSPRGGGLFLVLGVLAILDLAPAFIRSQLSATTRELAKVRSRLNTRTHRLTDECPSSRVILYRGTSLISARLPIGLYGGAMPRALWWS